MNKTVRRLANGEKVKDMKLTLYCFLSISYKVKCEDKPQGSQLGHNLCQK